MTDVIIIGGGPAGLSAAAYILRAGFSVKIFAKDFGALQKAEKIDNYFGFENPINGIKLIEDGRKQVVRLGADVITEEVTGITWRNFYNVSSLNINEQSKAIIFATGIQRKKIKIENLGEFEGRGVSYCAVCDAFFYKGKSVGVLGSGEYALNEIKELINISKSVCLITNGEKTETVFPESVKIETKPVSSLFGNEKFEGIRFTDNSKLFLDGLFIAYGTAGADTLIKKMGLVSKNSITEVDENMEIIPHVLPGLFAAGDCTGGIYQISVAVGEGAKAGLSAIEFLRKFV